MGNFHISIRGIGAHHNAKNPTDANRLAKEFVGQLRLHGHGVEEATFEFGGNENNEDQDDLLTVEYPPLNVEVPETVSTCACSVPESTGEAEGKAAYEAYCENAKWRSITGSPLPKWDDVPAGIKSSWRIAALAAVEARLGGA